MTATAAAPSTRVASLDVLRGLACVLMAIDHVRVYSGIPAGGPTPGIFLTRWVTHFVAPAFCFLAGASIYFLARQLRDTGAVRRFLITRGLLLVLLELTLIRFLWSFHVGTDFMLAGVIWMLGWCMVLLAPFVGLRARTVAAIGIAIVVCQGVFGAIGGKLPVALQPYWAFLYPAGDGAAFGINVLYVIVPWVGVMLAGFGFGALLERPAAAREALMYRLGGVLSVAFIAISAYFVAKGGTADWQGNARPVWMAMLDQRKYPASIPFLLMTLGPLILLVPLAERAKGTMAHVLDTLGRVPMWYYLQHLLIIHFAAIVVTWVRSGSGHLEWYRTAPYTAIPDEARWPLWLLYLVWALCVAVLYPICAAYAERKRSAPAAWMKYI